MNELIARLRELAGLVRRMPPPSARQPEAFHIARDALGHELDQLANQFTKLR